MGSLFLEVEKVVRGCQKRIVYFKSTGSEVFSDAYFVVRDDALSNISECDIIKEANRILDECVVLKDDAGTGQVIVEFIKRNALPFVSGAVIGILITLLIK